MSRITRVNEEQKNVLAALAEILKMRANIYERGIDKVSGKQSVMLWP